MSIRALDHFAKYDTHAMQYSLIAQDLLTIALEHLEKRELQERLQRTETSSQLFGLIPLHDGSSLRSDVSTAHPTPSPAGRRDSLERSVLQHHQPVRSPHVTAGDIDSAFFGLGESLTAVQDGTFWNTYHGTDGDSGSALNLFPLLDAGGGIDLAHYL